MPNWKSIIRFISLFGIVLWLPQGEVVGQAPTPAANAGDAQAADTPKLSPQAQVAARRGIEFLESKEYKKSIEMFKVAVRMHPQQAELQHFLGVAYAQDKQLGPAWLHFRQAVRLNPRHANAVRDFSSLWQAFEARGIFHCGRTREQLTQFVGKPDKVSRNGATEVWEYGFKQLHLNNGRLAAVVDPRGLSAAIANGTHRLEIKFDEQPRWRLGYRTVSRIHALSEYIPAGQSIGQWNELYTVQRIHGLAKKQTPGEMMKQMEENLKKQNPNVEFAVLAEGEGDVMFQWRDVGDKDRKPQHEIVRLLTGTRDIHRLAYAQRVPLIPTETAKTWVDVLQRARLVPTTSSATAPATLEEPSPLPE